MILIWSMEWIEGDKPARDDTHQSQQTARSLVFLSLSCAPSSFFAILTSVDAENLVVYYDTQGQKVKHVGKVVPDVGVAVLARALGVEAVGLGDAAGFVVASDQMDSVGVS